MQENQTQSKFMVIMKKIWPFINRVLNTIFYFFIGIIKGFFKNAIQMIKGN